MGEGVVFQGLGHAPERGAHARVELLPFRNYPVQSSSDFLMVGPPVSRAAVTTVLEDDKL